ncbi:MAG: metallophosphoesterase family protein [Planctomycetota bacterium]|nr:metallophosphoesterase family protein [Planctomycetota bacterium]
MLQAIISDVHSNLEAFETTLFDIRKRFGQIQIISLGDLIGYGPNPIECILIAIENNIINIRGNHEVALSSDKSNFNPVAQKAINWTKQIIQKNLLNPLIKNFFQTVVNEYRPEGQETGGVVYAHGSPRGVIDEYVVRRDDLFKVTDEVRKNLKENFESVDEIGFLGHTHIPYICTTDFYLIHPEWQSYEPYPLLSGTKTIVNVGSVGQPRDNDTRACYVTFDGKNVTHYRVEYNISKTVERMKQVPELDEKLWKRLMKGV